MAGLHLTLFKKYPKRGPPNPFRGWPNIGVNVKQAATTVIIESTRNDTVARQCWEISGTGDRTEIRRGAAGGAGRHPAAKKASPGSK
jgi:hypothetical protein